MDAFLASRVLTKDDDWADAIGRAVSMQAAADDVVRAVVQQARRNGATWQVIGDALGVSRQAAFQRYGKPIDPRTGEPMNTTPLPGAAELAASVIGDLASGQWTRVTEQFDPAMRDGLSEEALAAAWAQIIGLSGAFEGRGEPEVTRAGDVTITNTPLSFEAGDYTARISFRDDRAIAGLHILEGQTP
ncbi:MULTISPECIES: DUF3887 domain-containing protein [Nocardiopsidaceae]|uniref:DUF3887 domain-containing protein n=1 Tax=Streptomonospora nanhaiensis TaxID=1323731 RepID=A0ABY6YWP9_9ACTN|nr:DUF3887 domain-containing protein [Streptomonospora nanhaiensis]WAE76623.1 DUF3887 domain-containing protein [Streptomonospora nanhaiensis]